MRNSRIVGLDVGGTKIEGVLYDGRKVLKAKIIPTPKNLKDFKSSAEGLFKYLTDGKAVAGLGVAQKGVLNAKTGRLLRGSAGNLAFLEDFPLREFYKGLGGKNVLIGNDAQCFAWAEALRGLGKKYKNFAVITLGTSIGGGIIIDRKLFTGSHGSASHFAYIAADARHKITYYYKRARGDKKDFKKISEIAGKLIADITNILDPEAIIFGGTLAIKTHRHFLKKAIRLSKKYLVNHASMPKIVISRLAHTGALGGALLFNKN